MGATGWCNGECLDGTNAGSNNEECKAGDGDWYWGSCSSTVGCSVYDECSTCTSDDNCGTLARGANRDVAMVWHLMHTCAWAQGGATVPVWLAPRRVLPTANAPQVVATGTGTRAARIAAHCTPATHARTRKAVVRLARPCPPPQTPRCDAVPPQAGVPPAASALLETRTAPPPTRAAVPMTTTTAPGSTTLARTALCTRTARRARTKAAAGALVLACHPAMPCRSSQLGCSQMVPRHRDVHVRTVWWKRRLHVHGQ